MVPIGLAIVFSLLPALLPPQATGMVRHLVYFAMVGSIALLSMVVLVALSLGCGYVLVAFLGRLRRSSR